MPRKFKVWDAFSLSSTNWRWPNLENICFWYLISQKRHMLKTLKHRSTLTQYIINNLWKFHFVNWSGIANSKNVYLPYIWLLIMKWWLGVRFGIKHRLRKIKKLKRSYTSVMKKELTIFLKWIHYIFIFCVKINKKIREEAQAGEHQTYL